jgi:hypothetical protein
MREVGPGGVSRETPFLQLVPGWFDHVSREVRFFEDWSNSSTAVARVFDHWGLGIYDHTQDGHREVGFVPRPLRTPKERLLANEDTSVHMLMDGIEAIDREVGLPFAWFFLMTHGHWVDPDVGRAIAVGLRENRVRLPDHDAEVLLR